MLETKYIEGADVPQFDDRVTRAIESYSVDGSGQTMEIGVENLDGDIYRVIRATGLGVFLNITSKLSSLGLVDRLANYQRLSL